MTRTKRILISLVKSALIILLITVFVTFSIDIDPLVEPDEMVSFPDPYIPVLSLILYSVAPIAFFATVQQFDTVKRRELLSTYKGLDKKRQIMLQTLRSFSFWSDTLCLLLPLTALGAMKVIPELILQGRKVGWLAAYGLSLLCYALPLTAIFLYFETSIRHTWYRESEFVSRTSEETIEKYGGRTRQSYGMLFLNVFCIGLGIYLLPSVYWMLMAYIITGANALRGNLVNVLLWILAITALLILRRALKTVVARRKFFKEMHKICSERGYKLNTRINTLRGLFYCTGREDFTVETSDKRYAGTILPIPSKRCTLYFRLDYDGGGYNFRRAVFRFMVFFPRHKLDFSAVGASESEQSTEKILLLTREPADLLVGDRKRTWRAHNGAHSGEYTVYDATAFCHFIDRLSL